MNQNNLLLIFGFALISVAMFFPIWWLTQALVRVPDENREDLDRPPLFYRMLYFMIHPISFYIKPFISEARREKISGKIRLAGLDYVFSAENVQAMMLVSSLMFGFFAMVCCFLLGETLLYTVPFLILGWLYPQLWITEKSKVRARFFLKNMPFFLDMITLSVEAGLNFNGALQQAVLKSPQGVVRQEFARVLREIKAGKNRMDALREVAERVDEPSLKGLISSIVQAEKMGMSMGPILRIQAEQRRVERFLLAEKKAMEAPVKMLFPLVAFIFPCTFIVIGFPVYVMMVEAFK